MRARRRPMAAEHFPSPRDFFRAGGVEAAGRDGKTLLRGRLFPAPGRVKPAGTHTFSAYPTRKWGASAILDPM
jgi:hypothetical protein